MKIISENELDFNEIQNKIQCKTQISSYLNVILQFKPFFGENPWKWAESHIFGFISVLLSLHHNHPCFIYKVIIHITKYHNIQGWSCRGWSVSPCARVWRGRGSRHCCTLLLLLLRSIVGRQRVSVNFFIAYCLNSSHAWFYFLQCIVDTDLRAWLLVKLDRTARKRMA